VIPTVVLAHSWGWDEAVYFGVPIVAAVAWVRWIEKRARQRREAPPGDGDQEAPPDEGAPGSKMTGPE
jgi:hypothetical protein